MELLNLGQVPLEGRDGIGHFEVLRRQRVASTLIAGERGLRACGCRLREEFRVDECVGDSVGRKRILEVAGIANERPARSERLSKEPHLSRKRTVLLNLFRPFHDGRQVGPAFPQHVPVSGVCPPPQRFVETDLGNRGKYTRGPIIGRDRAGAHTWAVVPVVSIEPRVRPVAEDHAGRMTARSIASRADESGDRGPNTIGSNHEFSRYLALPLATISEAYTADATVVRSDEVDKMRFERDLGTGCLRGIDQHPVDDGTPGCVKTINVVPRFDLHRDDFVAIVKGRRSDHRGARRSDAVQYAPAR